MRNATERAGERAEKRFGALARRELLAAGISQGQIRVWLRTGRLHPQYPGVYSWGRPDLPVEGELAAALLFAGAGSALDSLTALWWQELLGRRPGAIHVAAPGRRRSRFGVAIRHPAEVRRRMHRGLPVVPLAQALLAAAEHLSRDSLRLILARAEFGRLLSLQDVQAALGRGRSGTAAVRAALDAHLPALARCANRFEREFVLLCERERIEIPEPNERIGRWRPDMLWRRQMLIVELDGKDAHSTAAQRNSDRRRQAALEALGFRVIRFSWADVRFAPGEVTARLRRELAATPPRIRDLP